MAEVPILYTFRRCPYAMRARMGLAYAGIEFQIREVVLKDKPLEMLDESPKATVPVLLRGDLPVLEESLDILEWSLSENDPDGWIDYPADKLLKMRNLVEENDNVFKLHLDHYKYSDRFPEHSREVYRQAGESFLQKLEVLLLDTTFLFGDRISYADVAIFPFIRQFSNVEPTWFAIAPYPGLRKWLASFLNSILFQSVMKKYPPWVVGQPVLSFSQHFNQS
jgi:glutathione S-transferase